MDFPFNYIDKCTRKYRKVSLDEVRVGDVLYEGVGDEAVTCGIICKRLDCHYFITTNAAVPPVCTVYSDRHTGGGAIQGDVTAWVKFCK